jgi:small subunit ribosomal protein S6
MATKTSKTVKKKKKVVKKVAVKLSKSVKAQNYELLAAYPLSENEIAVEKDLAEFCKKASFDISKVDKWGVKDLAYEIRGESKGYYLRFILKGGVVRELENLLKIDDKILRYIIVRI